MEGFQEKQISIEKMQLTVTHLFPHLNAREKADVRQETERKLFVILKKYSGCEYDGV